MNDKEIDFWWEDFCNSCMNENCKQCETPKEAIDNLLNLFVLAPSNYKKIEVKL